MNGAGELFRIVDPDSGDADLSEAKSELLADYGGVLGIPEPEVARLWEPLGPELVLRRERLLR